MGTARGAPPNARWICHPHPNSGRVRSVRATAPPACWFSGVERGTAPGRISQMERRLANDVSARFRLGQPASRAQHRPHLTDPLHIRPIHINCGSYSSHNRAGREQGRSPRESNPKTIPLKNQIISLAPQALDFGSPFFSTLPLCFLGKYRD